MPIVTQPTEPPGFSGRRLRALLPERAYASRLWLRSRGQVQIVDVDEIEWIASELRYSWIHLRGGGSRRIREPIGQLDRRLDPARFARVHRSAIVSLDDVAEAISSALEMSVVLKSGTRVRMSRSGRLRLLDASRTLR